MQASSLVNNTAIIQSYASTIIPESALGIPCHVPLIVPMGVTAWWMTGAKWTIQLSMTRVEDPRTTRELIHIKAPPFSSQTDMGKERAAHEDKQAFAFGSHKQMKS